VFTRRLLSDFLTFPLLRDATFVLHDIDADRLGTADRLAHRLAEIAGAEPRVESHLDRREALRGADFVVNTIERGSARATRLDFAIPARYGLSYAINDTVGVGGVFRGLRVIPSVLEIARDVEDLCPDAWFLTHTNPMAMVVRALAERTRLNTVGLWHAVGQYGR
jgi:alpha-galactosidase